MGNEFYPEALTGTID